MENNIEIDISKLDESTFLFEYHNKEGTSFATLMTRHKAIYLMDKLQELLNERIVS